MHIKELSNNQRRQLIDTQQVFEAWRAADQDHKRRFAGSMRWATRGATDYLLRKVGAHETSLGPRAPETEAAHTAFMDGRQANTERRAALSRRLDELAAVNVAMGLGRMPVLAARIIRRCDDKGLLGQSLFIVGPHALYAFEAIAGVHVTNGLVASGDIDLPFDARRRLSVALAQGLRDTGFIGLLQQVDKSFTLPRPRAFRAANKDGYLVDLIRPEPRNALRDTSATALTDLPEDMEGAAIFGLAWLINAPKCEAVVLDDRGYPARLVVVDPRVFALHKAWLAERKDRDPLKAGRDYDQAVAAAAIATRYMRLAFDADDLSALPADLRARAPRLAEDLAKAAPPDRTSPNW